MDLTLTQVQISTNEAQECLPDEKIAQNVRFKFPLNVKNILLNLL
jgi:hypothetical protein